MIEQGAVWLDAQRRAHLTQTITYVRGEASVEVLATIGRTEFEQVDDYGAIHKFETRDFLVTVVDLVLGEVQITPQAEDRIKETSGETVHLYDVMAPGGEPVYRYSDAFRLAYRIHTKHIGTEEA